MFLHCVVAEYGIFAVADRRNGSAKNGGVSRFPDDHDYRLLFTCSPLALIDERVWNWWMIDFFKLFKVKSKLKSLCS